MNLSHLRLVVLAVVGAVICLAALVLMAEVAVGH
jgi:hypothetical protein